MRGPLELGDYDGLEDEAFPPLPPPQSPGQGGQDEGDPFGNGEKLFEMQFSLHLLPTRPAEGFL